MEPEERHLTEEEICRAVEAGETPKHAEQCDACSRSIALAREGDKALKKISEKSSPRPGPNCASTLDIAGLVTGARKDEALLVHVSQCDWCGEQLRQALHDLSQELTDEENKLVASLTSGRPEWQAQLASSLAKGKRSMWALYAAAAAIVLTSSVIGAWWLLRPSSNEIGTLLAKAYTQSRPFDYRLPDDGYAEAHSQRSAGASPLAKPPALLKADALLSEQSRQDARYWRLRGTAELLHSNPERAVESLSKAKELAVNDIDIDEELAIAYALRAEAGKPSVDLGNALELLSSEARGHPNDPRLIFNLALIYEQDKMPEEAIQQWQNYLKLESASKWADEARHHLQVLLERRSLWKRLRQQYGEDEQSFLNHPVPEHDDEYLERTALDWLRRASEKSEAKQAVGRLASSLYQRHSDAWLQDVLHEALATNAVSGVLELADLNLHGDSDGVIRTADDHIRVLERNGQTALAARARFELVYALHRAPRASDCEKASTELERQLKGREFPWLEIQNRIEYAVCSSMLGHEGDAIQEYGELFRQAQAHHFLSLSLRASALADDAQTLAGNAWETWRGSIAGLDEYWRSGISPTRAYQLDFNLASAASRLGLWVAATEFAQAALDELEKVGNFPTEALGNAWAAEAARKAGLIEVAAGLFDRAAMAESKASASETTRRYEWRAELYRVQAEFDHGQTQEAKGRLARLSNVWKASEMPFAQQLRKQTLEGELALRSGDYIAARQYLNAAVQDTQTRLASFKSDADRSSVMEYAGETVKALMRVVLADSHNPAEALNLWLGFLTSGNATQSNTYGCGRETWLIYTVLGDRVGAWLKDADGIFFRWIPASPAEISQESKRILRLASDADSSVVEMQGISTGLFVKLIGPFAQRIKAGSPLMIIADEELAEVPFGLLASDRGELLGVGHPLVLCSRFNRDILGPLAVTKWSPVLAIAESSTKAVDLENLPPLPQADAEARSVAERFAKAKLLEDGDITPDMVRSLAPGIELFHFSGHGYSNSGNGALMLRRTLLTAKEIMQSNWKQCKIAVLSACLTAAGEVRGPVNPNSLVRAFLVSGAKSVVASQWNIDSAATKEFMDVFYGELLAGISIPEAIRRARLAIRAVPSYKHPYYWGAFVVFQ